MICVLKLTMASLLSISLTLLFSCSISSSAAGRVFLYRTFLSDEECDHLISLAHGGIAKSLVKAHDSGKIVNESLLANSVAALDIEQDDIVTRIEDRISAWTLIPKENGEHVQILHYLPEETKQHLDYYGAKSQLGTRVPLMATVVLYLSNVTQGGEILFQKSEFKNTQLKDETWSKCAKTGYAVRPIKGNAVLFFNMQPNTIPDETSSHARCPVLEGEKWCATKFFHVRAIYGEKALLESDNGECTDEEDNCPRWAALGECERNPVYMIGSPDYYGTCRKSCNVC